jgi:hypothetical protein
MTYADLNPQFADSDNVLLQKILLRLGNSGGTTVNLSVSDIEIGAVELKDASTDNRASISAGGAVSVAGTVFNSPVRNGSILTTTPLGAGASFTQAWQDSTSDGTITVECTVRADQASGNLGFTIQETDDPTNVNFTQTLTAFTIVSNVTLTARTPIRAKFYRVVYTNGATPQGSFELTQTTGTVVDATLAIFTVTDPLNSTNTPLGANATFTGAATDLLNFKSVTVAIFSDQPSAIGGVKLEWSQNGADWDLINSTNLFASVAITTQDTVRARFFRIVYTNGATPQGVFRLQTLVHPTAPTGGVQQLSHVITTTDSALLTHSVLSGRPTAASEFVDVKVTNAGELVTSPTKLVTYQAVFRLTTRPYALSHVFAGAGRYQYATIHHTALSTKTVKLRHAVVALEDSSASNVTTIELVRITTAPATGNPVVTPTQSNSGDSAAEATCLALPTTQATEAGAPFGFQEWNLGNTGGVSTVNPPPPLQFQDLINPGSASEKDLESSLPTMRAGVLEGWAVTVDVSAAVTIKGFVILTFTEQ